MCVIFFLPPSNRSAAAPPPPPTIKMIENIKAAAAAGGVTISCYSIIQAAETSIVHCSLFLHTKKTRKQKTKRKILAAIGPLYCVLLTQ